MPAAQERACADERPRWKLFGEVTAIDAVELVEEREVGTEDLYIDEAIHGHPRLAKRPFDVQKNVLNVNRAKEEFDFYPETSLEVGLEKTYASIKEQYAVRSASPAFSWFDLSTWKVIRWDRV